MKSKIKILEEENYNLKSDQLSNKSSKTENDKLIKELK